VWFLRERLYPLASAAGATLVLVGFSPTLKTRATYCLPSRFAANALARCDTTRAAASNAAGEAALRALADAHDGVVYFPIMDLFCEPDRCRATIPGTDTFWAFDEHHFTVAGGMFLWPFWCGFFRSMNWFRG